MLGQIHSPTSGLKSYTVRKSREFPAQSTREESFKTGEDAFHGYAPSCLCQQEGADARRIARRVLNTKLKDRGPSPSKVLSATCQSDHLRPKCDNCKSGNISQPISSSQAQHGDYHPPVLNFPEMACTKVMHLPDENNAQSQSQVSTTNQRLPSNRCMQLGSPTLRIPNKRYIVQTIRPFPGQRAEGKRSKTIIVTKDPDILKYQNKEHQSLRDQSFQTQTDYRKDNFDNFRPSIRERHPIDQPRAFSEVSRVKSSSLSEILDEDIDNLNPADDLSHAPDKKVSTHHFKSFSHQQTGRLTRDTYAQVNVPLTQRDRSIQENGGLTTRRDTCVQVSEGPTHIQTRDFSCLTCEDNGISDRNAEIRRETIATEDSCLKQDKFTQETDCFIQCNLYPREVKGFLKRDKYTQEKSGVVQKDKSTQENGSFAQKDKYTQENCAPIRPSQTYPQENGNVRLQINSNEKKRASTFNKSYNEDTQDLASQKSSPPPDCPCRLLKMNLPENAPIPPPPAYQQDNAPNSSHTMYRQEYVVNQPQSTHRSDSAPMPPQTMHRQEDYQFPPQAMYHQDNCSMPTSDMYCPKHYPASLNGMESPREHPVSPQEMYFPENYAKTSPNRFYQEQRTLSPPERFYPENQNPPNQMMHGVHNFIATSQDMSHQEYRPQYQQSSSGFQKGFNKEFPNNDYSRGNSLRQIPQNSNGYDQCHRCEVDGLAQNNCQNVCPPPGAFKKYSELQVSENVQINSFRNQNIPLGGDNISYGNTMPQVISSQTQFVQARTVAQVGASPVTPRSTENINRAAWSPNGRGKSEIISQAELTQPANAERFSHVENPQNQRVRSEKFINISNSKAQNYQSETGTRSGSPKSQAMQTERLLRVKCTPGQSPQSEHYPGIQGQASQSNRSLRMKSSHGQQNSERSLRVKGSMSPVSQNEKVTRVTSTQGNVFQNENITREGMNEAPMATNRFENNEYFYQPSCQGIPCMNQQNESLPGASRSELVEGCCRRLTVDGRNEVSDKYCGDRCQNFSGTGLSANGMTQSGRLANEGYTNSNVQMAESAIREANCPGCLPSHLPSYSKSKTKSDLWSDNANRYSFKEQQLRQVDPNSDPNRITRPSEYILGSPPSDRQRHVDYADSSSSQANRPTSGGYINVHPDQGQFQSQYHQAPYSTGCVGCHPINSASKTQFNRNEPQLSQSFRANQREYIQEANSQARWLPQGQPSESRMLPQGGYVDGETEPRQKYRASVMFETPQCENGVCHIRQNYSDIPTPTLSWTNHNQGNSGNNQNGYHGAPEQSYQTSYICPPECGSSSRTDNRNKTCETSYIIKTVTKGTCHNDECNRIDPKCDWVCKNKEVQMRSRATSPAQEINMSQNRHCSSGVTIKIKAGGKDPKSCQESDNNNACVQRSNQHPKSACDLGEKSGGTWLSTGSLASSSPSTIIANPASNTLHSPNLCQGTSVNIIISPIDGSHRMGLKQGVIKISSKNKVRKSKDA